MLGPETLTYLELDIELNLSEICVMFITKVFKIEKPLEPGEADAFKIFLQEC
jgi:hypothetical protein